MAYNLWVQVPVQAGRPEGLEKLKVPAAKLLLKEEWNKIMS